MSKSLKITGVLGSAIIGLAVIAAIALLRLLDMDAYKARFEEAASDTMAMEVSVAGHLRIGFLPSLHVTLEDVHIRSRGTEVARASEARIGIAGFPLLRREIRIKSLLLEQPNISIERDQDGRYNFGKSALAREPSTDLIVPEIAFSDGTLRYVDRQSGEEFEADDCSLVVHQLHRSSSEHPGIIRDLAGAATFGCGEVRTKSYVVSALKFSATGQHGVFEVEPFTMTVFDGYGKASIRADFTGDVPLYNVRYELAQFRVERFLENLSAHSAAEGSMDFSAHLSMRGGTVHDLTQSMQGRITLRGNDLILNGYDLDPAFARYESSQTFNLVDLGALFFAGPVGLAITKGYNFAGILQGTDGRSAIRVLVSDWDVDRGVARSLDVAMATDRNRVALQGGLDFVNERFEHVTVALLDERGCIRAQQAIHGSFRQPVIEKPSTISALTGPVADLLGRLGRLFQNGECDVFYAGSVNAANEAQSD